LAKRKRDPRGQGTLSGMPDKGPVYDKAVKYLDARDELDRAKEKTDAIKKELIQLFIKKGVTSIQAEGNTIFYSHTESDQIKVKQSE